MKVKIKLFKGIIMKDFHFRLFFSTIMIRNKDIMKEDRSCMLIFDCLLNSGGKKKNKKTIRKSQTRTVVKFTLALKLLGI